MTHFDQPAALPGAMRLHMHDHDWVEVGAHLNPNGTWRAVFACTLCPDIGQGGHIGPVPPGYCPSCGWVQHRWPRRRCEECKTPLDTNPEETP